MKIGIYGGTFDPVHHAHLILAREVAESFGLSKVIFVPALTSPDKSAPIASGAARVEMLRAAVAGESLFEIDQCELQRPPPSYTIGTIELFQKKCPDSELFLLVGDDNVAGLPSWRRFSELEKMVTIVVLPRLKTEVKHKYATIKRRIDISATEIRERVAQRKPISYLVPPGVQQIIHAKSLYTEVKP
jgi:nicotinate-nucleotide adenylyltransferase